MGAYLSKPITEKVSSDENSNTLIYGASSMQGWRVYQEDAHNAILDFDKTSSLFAVYDGHGGHEVATYTAAELPKFIKNTDSFTTEQFTQALIDAFLEFDATLVQPEVLTVLKELAGSKDQDGTTTDTTTLYSDYDGEEVDHLCREAAMPLEEVMAKYSEDKQFQSPNIRLKKRVGCGSNSEEGCSSTDDGFDESFESKSVEDPLPEVGSSKLTPSAFINAEEKESPPPSCDSAGSADALESTSSLLNGIPNKGEPEKKSDFADSVETVNGEAEDKARVNGKIKDEGGGGATDPPESSDGGCLDLSSQLPSKTDHSESEGGEAKNEEESKDGVNGDTHSTAIPPSGKGKGKAKGKSILSLAMAQAVKVVQRQERKRKAAEMAERIYQQIQSGDDDEDGQSDEEDDNFEGLENCQGLDDTSSSEEEDDEEDSDLEEEDDEDEHGTDDMEEDNQYHEFSMNMREEPGYDSGCTACVALLNGRELFVANVGDSRCVVCRDGKALDMSIDHKPEDEPEANRITKAGGRITSDGRVNGGLNLSRALGDHSYKQNKNQSAAEQMISPLPDVRSLTLTPKDTFLVIACDGIWNSMSSQEVCDFVLERMETDTKLSTIAEEMFDHCLSPDAHGDGTGCDNMTCIVVKLHALFPPSERTKRACEKSEDAEEGDSQKRSRLEVQ